MKTLASVILFLLLAAPALADDSPAPQALPNTARQCGAKDQPRGDLPDILEAGRGCCSRHGGMSGQCNNGRVVCRDGSISPSCRCRADSKNPGDGDKG